MPYNSFKSNLTRMILFWNDWARRKRRRRIIKHPSEQSTKLERNLVWWWMCTLMKSKMKWRCLILDCKKDENGNMFTRRCGVLYAAQAHGQYTSVPLCVAHFWLVFSEHRVLHFHNVPCVSEQIISVPYQHTYTHTDTQQAN